MGGSYYSDDVFKSRINTARVTGKSVFTHDADVRAGKAKTVHEKLDPSRLNKAKKNVRESFDSVEHPNSRAVAIGFDVTGSMQQVPSEFVNKLGNLMKALASKYIPDAHVMMAMIGDATSDQYPLQIGQYEAGNEVDEALSLGILEGNGGGQKHESYQNFVYYMARHTDIDCWNKRKQKGITFICGDELIYPAVKRSEVKRLIGDSLEADIPTKEILEELKKKQEVFWIMPYHTLYATDSSVINPLKAMFGDHFLRLEEPSEICELIVATIGKLEGYSDNQIKEDLKSLGFSAGAATRAVEALSGFKTTVTKPETKVKAAKQGGVKRL